MRNFGIALIAAAALCLAAPAFGDGEPNECGNHGNNCEDGDDGGNPGGQGNPGGGVFTNTTNNSADAFSGVDFGGVDFGLETKTALTTTIDVSDRRVTRIEAADIPVASAAPVFASACSAGVSGQSMGFGGSLATTNPMCDMALAAEMARAVGNDELAYELTMEAATFARARVNIVRRFGQWIPFIGSLW